MPGVLPASLIACGRLADGCGISATIPGIHDPADSPDVKGKKRWDTTICGNKDSECWADISGQ
jgi:hypothetical protein